VAARDRALSELARTIDRVPGADRVLLAVARELDAGAEEYSRSHWGDRGERGPGLVRVPNAGSGLVLLGELVSIGYATRKGRSGYDDWVHEFSEPYPLLTYARDGSGLVIARGTSKYRVETRGIVG
jgi:hypothetical protein